MATEVREVNDKAGEPRLSRRAATVEEFWSLPESVLPAEYINGEIIVAPSPTVTHQTVVGNIYFAIRAHAQKTNIGKCFVSPLDIVLPTGEVVQPDILFLTNEKAKRSVTEKRIYGVPSLVVEILSPGSATLDTLTKRELYEQNGVREYWIVDPEMKSIAQLLLRKKRYTLSELSASDTVKSVVLNGFEMEVGPLLGL